LQEKGLMNTGAGKSSFAVLLFQDVAVIPMIAIMPLLALGEKHGGGVTEAAGHGAGTVESLPAWAQTLSVLGAVALVVVAGRYLVRPAFRIIARTRLREIFAAAALMLIIGIALLMAKVGLSPALGTFLAGVLLASSEYRHELESNIETFKGLLLGLFFITVGTSIDFWLVVTQPGLILGLLGGLILVKFTVLFVLGRLFKMGLDQNLLFAAALAQSGEFAFVLFSFATQDGVLGAEMAGELVAVVALSMALTPLLLLLNEKWIQPRFGTKEQDDRQPDTIDEVCPVIIVGFGRFGHIVGRLLSANGVNATVLDVDSDHVDLLRKLGLKVFYGDASRHDLLHSAGVEQAKLLVVAIDDEERTLRIVETARKNFPHLTIFARARGRAHAYELLEAGIDHVYRETLDTSLVMGVDVLRKLGFRSYQALRSARTFRRHDEKLLRELCLMRHDRKAYIDRARQAIQDLETILRDELAQAHDSGDGAWDVDSLRQELGRD
jgi:voltage-gated potassium channel Kch